MDEKSDLSVQEEALRLKMSLNLKLTTREVKRDKEGRAVLPIVAKVQSFVGILRSREQSREQRAQSRSRTQRAERAESREQGAGAENREQRAESREQRAESREQRAERQRHRETETKLEASLFAG